MGWGVGSQRKKYINITLRVSPQLLKFLYFLGLFLLFCSFVTLTLSVKALLSQPPQVLRTHVMVRVGGGWDTLEHYLDKHDPCRCAAFGEVTSCSLLY